MKSAISWLFVVVAVLVTAGVLLAMGRAPICDCGVVRLWHGDPMSPENSQHMMDWYTPSHLLHGLLFYAVLRWAFPRMTMGWRMFLAVLVEAAWEIVENTDAVIARYRAVTVSLDYFGDSVVNSVSDIIAMMIGFWLARTLPVWVSIAMFVGFEMLTLWLIRDGLVLNVLMLAWPLEAVRQWQSGL